MGSDHIHVVNASASLIFKLWLLALAGVVIPPTVFHFWPDLSWVGKTERALKHSLEDRKWQSPWQAIDQKEFTSGWVRCTSLEDAIRLDQRVDDGHPHTGNLILAEGGVAWRGQ